MLKPADLVLEFMMNALRLHEGFPTALFPARTGVPLCDIQSMLDTAIERGLILHENDRILATKAGFSYLNDLLQIFMSVDG